MDVSKNMGGFTNNGGDLTQSQTQSLDTRSPDLQSYLTKNPVDMYLLCLHFFVSCQDCFVDVVRFFVHLFVVFSVFACICCLLWS